MAGMPGLPPSAASLPPRLDMPPSVSLGNHLSGAPRPDHAAAAAAAASMAAAAAASQGGPPGQAAAAAAAAAANSAASNGPKSEVNIKNEIEISRFKLILREIYLHLP